VLKQLNKRLATLPEAQRPRVLLVSVDPERDTPDRLRDYVQFFDRTFLAATGTTAAVEQAATAFMVPYAKVPLDEGGYTMDHGAGLYVVAPSGAIVAYVSPPLNAEVLARDYRKIVQYVEDAH
jgi:protein SCO1/2